MAPMAQPLPSPDIDADTINRAYALAGELPDMNGSKHMQPIEAWFLWGVFFDSNGERAEVMLAWYLHHRRGMKADAAAPFARQIRETSTEGNSVFDSVANGGQQASRSGYEGCFISAARFIQQAWVKAN